MGPNALFPFIRSSKQNALTHLSIFGAIPPAIYRDFIGAVGRRSGALFFARHPDYFVVTRKFTAVYLDLQPFRSFTVTLGFAALYRDWQKTRHPDTDANSLNRRAVRLQCIFIAICPLAPELFCGATGTTFLLRDRFAI